MNLHRLSDADSALLHANVALLLEPPGLSVDQLRVPQQGVIDLRKCLRKGGRWALRPIVCDLHQRARCPFDFNRPIQEAHAKRPKITDLVLFTSRQYATELRVANGEAMALAVLGRKLRTSERRLSTGLPLPPIGMVLSYF